MHILRYFILPILGCLSLINAVAASLNINPGTLRQAVGADPAAVTSLTLTGAMDITDFEFITLEMTSLRSLDLSGVEVAAYSGDATFTGRTESPANTLPDAALMVASLQQISLPATLTAIGNGALGSTAISEISLPASLKSIGDFAFANCNSLRSITIPPSVTSLGEAVFMGDASLKSAVVNASVATLPAATFRGCPSLSEVSLPTSISAIASQAFAGCSSLEDITLPGRLASIGDYAFYGAGLRELDLLSCTTLAEIGNWAFACNPALSAVVFPSSLSTLGSGAFFNDETLSMTSLPEVSHIADYSLRGISAASTLSIPEGVTSIGNHALANWTSVQMLTLPSTLESIGTRAMANWTDLRTIDFGSVVAIPSLGEEVWASVDQPAVDLKVSRDFLDEFRSTPQWQEFNVMAKPDDITDIPAIDSEASPAITASFEGLTLIIDAPRDIAAVQIFDLNGRSFSLPLAGLGTLTTRVDTSAWDSSVMILRVILADSTAATLKLHR